MKFGIGRLPSDVDLIEERLAQIEAERLDPTPKPRPEQRRLRCKRCGQSGYSGEYPFSTNPASNICDDCL